MPIFVCSSRDSRGRIRREVREAASSEAAACALGQGGLTVLSIQEKPWWQLRLERLWNRRGISFQDVVFAERQLAMLLKSGIDLSTALKSMSKQITHEHFSRIIHEVHESIIGGDTLSESLEKHAGVFPPICVGLVRAGEESGRLGECLEEVALLGMRDLDIRSRVKSAFMYPGIVLVMASLITLGFLVFVLPRFIEVFKSSGAEIPLPTQGLMLISTLLTAGWPLLVVGIPLGLYLLLRYYRTPPGRLVCDGLRLRFPLFGRLLLIASLSRLSRTLGTLLQSGIPVDRALGVAAVVCGNAFLEKKMLEARSAVIDGETLHDAMADADVVPEILLQMIASGELSGSLDVMLAEAGEYYDQETTYTIRNLVTALEPIMLIFMGVLVGGMALAVLLPLFRMTQVYR